MKRLPGIEIDGDRLDINGAVGDLDDGVCRIIGLPLRKSVIDAREVFAGTHQI